MSRYWGYYCLDCKEESGHWLNHGEDVLREFKEAMEYIADAPIFDYVTIVIVADTFYDDLIKIWLSDHKHHRIILIDEYGYNENGEKLT